MTIYNDENKYFDMQLTSWNKSLYIYKYINPFKMAKIRLSTNFSDSPRIYFKRLKGFKSYILDLFVNNLTSISS